MNVRGLYLAAGVLWAIILGPLVFAAVFGASAGFAWLYVLGDNPWPSSAEKLLLLPALFAGLFIAASMIWLGYRRGKKRTPSPPSGSVAELRRARTQALIPFVVLILVGAALWLRARANDNAMNATTAREASFADLARTNRKITAINIADIAGDVRATVRLSGTRDGPYHLAWRVVPSTSATPVLTGDASLQLARGENLFPIAFSMDELRRQYRAVVLHGRGNALVDEFFRLEVVLAPLLSPREISQLPPEEQRRIETAESPLRSQASAQFPVRLTIPP